MRSTAILTVVFLMMGLTVDERVDPPLSVSFRLADSVRIAGRITAWDADGFDGSFGRRRWIDLNTNDAARLYRRVMNRDSAVDWVNLGRFLLLMPRGEDTAVRAFAEALRLDPASQELIDAARAEAEAHAAAMEEARQAEQTVDQRTRSPEAIDWPADPWPLLTDEQRAEAVEDSRHHARVMLDRAGDMFGRLETDNVMVFSQLARQEAAQWARTAERAIGRTKKLLGIDQATRIFHGKAVLMISDDQALFRRIESAEFDHVVTASTIGVCHYDGPNVVMNFHRPADGFALRREISRQAVRACLHRHVSPRKLPLWANEGLPEFIVTELTEDTQTMSARRKLAIKFVRGGGDIVRVMRMTYDDHLTPDQQHLPATVGALLIELMSQEKPAAFARWVAAVKSGKDWPEAIRDDYGVTPEALLQAFVAYYRVND